MKGHFFQKQNQDFIIDPFSSRYQDFVEIYCNAEIKISNAFSVVSDSLKMSCSSLKNYVNVQKMGNTEDELENVKRSLAYSI